MMLCSVGLIPWDDIRCTTVSRASPICGVVASTSAARSASRELEQRTAHVDSYRGLMIPLV